MHHIKYLLYFIGGELTPTLKLKRNVAIHKHKALIESLYLDPNL